MFRLVFVDVFVKGVRQGGSSWGFAKGVSSVPHTRAPAGGNRRRKALAVGGGMPLVVHEDAQRNRLRAHEKRGRRALLILSASRKWGLVGLATCTGTPARTDAHARIPPQAVNPETQTRAHTRTHTHTHTHTNAGKPKNQHPRTHARKYTHTDARRHKHTRALTNPKYTHRDARSRAHPHMRTKRRLPSKALSKVRTNTETKNKK